MNTTPAYIAAACTALGLALTGCPTAPQNASVNDQASAESPSATPTIDCSEDTLAAALKAENLKLLGSKVDVAIRTYKCSVSLPGEN